jgi:N-acetylmuramoyl-L-alanine amidase
MSLPTPRVTIHVVYPHPSHEVYDDSTFVMGQVRGASGAWRLQINDQDVPASSHGFFAWKLDLHPGMNPVKIRVFENNSTHPVGEDLFALHRMPPLEAPPSLPLLVVTETLQPAQDVWLTSKDSVTVACLASQNVEVSLTIPGLIDTPVPLLPVEATHAVPITGGFVDTREMIFAKPHWTKKRIPAKGYYHAVVPLEPYLNSASAPLQNLPILLQLKHQGQTRQITLPGRLTVLKSPLLALVQQENAVSRTSPEDGARLTPQKRGTLIFVDGLKQNWVRARLSPDECIYLPKEAVQFIENAQAVAPAHLNSVQLVSSSECTTEVVLNLSGQNLGAPPIQIEALPLPGPHRLHVRLYHVQSRCDFIQYPAGSPIVRQVHWRQVGENTVELWIDLDRPLAGYDYALRDGQWHLFVKTLPQKLQDIRVLIDPGHGGSETGATGLNGIREKDLNLTVSKLLETALRSEGFQTVMTRTQDVEVSLPARQEKAVREKADIVLSIHHNALPDGRDPLKAIGACTFYYHPFSKPLAEALLQGLTCQQGAFDIPSYGLFYDSLFIPRIHQALSVLVEVGFFTNPAEFERLINPAFQQELAHRLARALKDYCQLQPQVL